MDFKRKGLSPPTSRSLKSPEMDVTCLLLATLLVCLYFLTAYSHLVPEEKPRDDRSLRSNSSMNLLGFPSVYIVALNKKSKNISRKEAEKKKRFSKGEKRARLDQVSFGGEEFRGHMTTGAGGDPMGVLCGHEPSGVRMSALCLRTSRSSQTEVRTGGAGVAVSDSPSVSLQKQAPTKKVARAYPPPPTPCIATHKSCWPPAPTCCDPCASCQCRFFRSACSCRVLSRTC
ncbi:hypothetical protein MC885_000565 [Smutsia gigantea]|nr:hypothetical protein MC885_000565 [Smutsia gigantea]